MRDWAWESGRVGLEWWSLQNELKQEKRWGDEGKKARAITEGSPGDKACRKGRGILLGENSHCVMPEHRGRGRLREDPEISNLATGN